MSMRLFPYQEKAVQFILRTPRCILRLDTGLGKTAVCVNAALKSGSRKILVIAPAFLLKNWRKEIGMWGGDGLDWTVVSYTKAGKINNAKKLGAVKWDMIICDEAHYLKNWEAKRTQNIVYEIIGKTPYVVLSTATPYVRSAADYHPLFSVCEPGKWGKFGTFAEKFCQKKPNHFKRWKKWDYFGVNERFADELRRESSRFMLTVRKRDVLKDLPEKIETDWVVEVGEEFSLAEIDEGVIDLDTGKIIGRDSLSTKCRELGLEKARQLITWLDDFDRREPVVIFCKHLSVQSEIVEMLDDKVAVINGKTSLELRNDIVERFQNGEYRYLVATMASCGVGLNLTAASRCVFVELPWSYTELKQCADRLHRIGQKSCVNVYHMVADGTVDELILSVLRRKIDGENLSIGSM